MGPVSIQLWLLIAFLVIAAIFAIVVVKLMDHFRLHSLQQNHRFKITACAINKAESMAMHQLGGLIGRMPT